MILLTRFAKNAVILPTYISFISNIKFWQLFYGFLFRILSGKLNNNTPPRQSKITYEENLHNNSPSLLGIISLEQMAWYEPYCAT